MSETVETREYKGVTIKIFNDDDPVDPRKEFDHLGTMVCWHRRYNLGDDHDFSGPDDFALFVKHNKCVVVPIYMYDHSGIGLSVTRDRYPYNCPWDSGQLGWIYVTYERIADEFKISRVVASRREKIKASLIHEVEEYHAYLSGQVYGYVVERDSEYIAGCSGFFGDVEYCMSEAVGEVDAILKHEQEEATRVNQTTQLCCSA